VTNPHITSDPLARGKPCSHTYPVDHKFPVSMLGLNADRFSINFPERGICPTSGLSTKRDLNGLVNACAFYRT